MGFFKNSRRLAVADRLGKNSETYKDLSKNPSEENLKQRKKLAGKIKRDNEYLKIVSENNQKSKQKVVNNQTSNSIHNEANGVKLEAKQVVGYQSNKNNGKNVKSYKPKKSTKSKK